MAKNQTRYEQALKIGSAANVGQQWEKALGAFRVALDEFPKQPAPYAGLGEACMGLKQWGRALECYKLAARYSGGDMSYLNKVTDIQERLGQLSEAGRTYMAIGELLLRRNQLDEAIDNWERAVRLEPNLLGAHRRLAMVFQRQNKTKEAVREYLAIARILQAQGDKEKALLMCRAALRLDSQNADVLKAVELIRHGEAAFGGREEEEEVPVPAEESPDGIVGVVRQMAHILESERQAQQPAQARPESNDPVQQAHRLAQEQLAEEIFREESNEDMTGAAETGFSKLERDALIGQGMDFESRGQLDEAINCYEQAMSGGLRMPAAYFTLGVLYLQQERLKAAHQALRIAAQAPAYREASQVALGRLQQAN